MKPVYKRLLITVTVSIGLGILAIVPVVTSDNGYVAGFVVLPLLFLIGLVSLALFIAAFACLFLEKYVGLYLLLAMVLLPGSFICSGILAKQLELGSYREEPMRPIIPAVANKVVFKKDATHEDVQNFWREVLSDPVGESGSDTRPGIQSIGSSLPENGHEVVVFAFFPGATDAEKADVRSRIRAYEPVQGYFENVETKPPPTPETSVSNSNDVKLPKKGAIYSTNSKQKDF